MTETAGRRSSGETRPLRILFVCTANISRSPYAERRARQALTGWNVEFHSAGIPGYPGRGMDREMAHVLELRGGSAEGHVSQAVSDELMRDANLVLPFEFAQHMKLLEAFPDQAAKILGVGQVGAAARAMTAAWVSLLPVDDVDDLAELVAEHVGVNSMSYDIEDPYRRGPKVALACADQIDEHLDLILPLLSGADLPKLAASEPRRAERRGWPWARIRR